MNGINPAALQKELERLKAVKASAGQMMVSELNRITDRHLARCKKNTPVGISPNSPTLRDRWDRSGVQQIGGDCVSEVFNTAEYASFFELGHRQTPGRVVFIRLSPGQQAYGQTARLITSGKHAGEWGIYLKLKQPWVKGRFVLRDSEEKAQQELDAAGRRILKAMEGMV